MSHISKGNFSIAHNETLKWRKDAPGNVMALVALGETFEAMKNREMAARAYGSIIDLFPSRVDMRRMAGERLERLGVTGMHLAVDTFEKAVADRPDHPSSHRLYAYSLLKMGQWKHAFDAIEKGVVQSYPSGRFASVGRLLKEDMAIIGAAWAKHSPKQKTEIADRLSKHGLSLDTRMSTRFVLHWESDANDVDLHIYDKNGNHAFYSTPNLKSGGSLYADITNGYGPECFTVLGAASAQPYTIQAHYYNRGPMGYGMGTLHVIEHDGAGGVHISHRPFVVMKDGAYVGLGTHVPSAAKSSRTLASN